MCNQNGIFPNPRCIEAEYTFGKQALRYGMEPKQIADIPLCLRTDRYAHSPILCPFVPLLLQPRNGLYFVWAVRYRIRPGTWAMPSPIKLFQIRGGVCRQPISLPRATPLSSCRPEVYISPHWQINQTIIVAQAGRPYQWVVDAYRYSAY